MTSRIAILAVDAVKPKVVAGFWCAVLGWRVVEQSDDGISIALRADGVSTEVELERLLELGARRVDVGQAPDASWVVLADPEGNEFCPLSRAVQDL